MPLALEQNYIYMAEKYSKCYGKNTIKHEDVDLNQSVGVHMPRDSAQNHLIQDESKSEKVMNYLREVIEVLTTQKNIYVDSSAPRSS